MASKNKKPKTTEQTASKQMPGRAAELAACYEYTDSDYKKWAVPVFAIGAYFLLLIQGTLDNKLHESVTIAALIITRALGILAWVRPTWRATAKDRMNLGTIMPFVYIFWCAITSLYAAAGKLALHEVCKILAVLPIVLAIIIFAKKSARGLDRIFAIFAIATAAIGVLSVDSASCHILTSIFNVVMTPVSDYFQSMGGYETGVRIRGMLTDPNLYSGVMALGTIMSLHLAKARRCFGSYVLLGLNTLSYILAFSMGSLFIFLLSCIAMLLLEAGGKRASLFILLAEDAVCTLVMAFISFAGLGAAGGARFLPMLALCANFALLWVIDRFIGSKIGDRLGQSPKVGIIAIGVIAAAIIAFALAALNVTGAKTLMPGEGLSRAAYLSGGEYVLSLDVSQTGSGPADLHVSITSQDETDLKVHTNDLLAQQGFGTEGAENQTLSLGFTVPDDSEIVMVNLYSASGLRVNDATYEGPESGSLKLEYKLLPGFMANRIQNLGANENAVQRTVFFQDGMKLFKMSPVFGRGLGGFENGVMAVQNFFYETKYAHNHYIQMLCDCGIIGFLIFTAMGVISAVYVISARKGSAGDESEAGRLRLYAVPALGAAVVQMYGQSFSDAVWSSGAYQIVGLSLIALVGILLRDGLFKAGQAAEAGEAGAFRQKAVFSGAMALMLVLSLMFTVTIGYNSSTRTKLTGGMATMEMIAKAADAEKYEYADYYISYLNSEAANPGIGDPVLCDKYAGKILELNSNSAYRSAANFYFVKGRDEKAFAALDRGADYVRSSGDTWQYIFSTLEDNFDIMGPNSDAAMNRAQEKGTEYETILKYYDGVRERNKEYLDNVTLAPRNVLFVGRLLELREKGYYDNADAIATIVACAMFDTKYACDADLNGIPDFLSAALGIEWKNAGEGSCSFTASVNAPATLSVTFVPKYGGSYPIKVYCDNPHAVKFSQGGAPLETYYADGYAFVKLELDNDPNAGKIGQIEITFDAPCEVSEIVMYCEEYLSK